MSEAFLSLKQMVRDKFVQNPDQSEDENAISSADVNEVTDPMNQVKRVKTKRKLSGKIQRPVLVNNSKLGPLLLLGQYLHKIGVSKSEAFAFLETRRVDSKYESVIMFNGRRFAFTCRNPAVSKDEACKRFLNHVYPGMYGNRLQTSCKNGEKDWLRFYYQSIGLSDLWNSIVNEAE